MGLFSKKPTLQETDGGQRPGSSPGTQSRAGIELIDENEAISRMDTGAEQELGANYCLAAINEAR
jgi:hypothetical protein